jgi:hypothetical protein
MNRYQKLREEIQKEADGFPMFFAYSMKQFGEGLAKLGLDMTRLDELARVPHGGYLLREDLPRLKAMMDGFDKKLADALKDEDFLMEALVYELNNHECCYTHEHKPALDALGLKEADVPARILVAALGSAEWSLTHNTKEKE